MPIVQLYAFGASFETGPRHVGSAWNVNKGGLYLLGQGRFYTKHDVTEETGVTVWDSQLSSSLYWGLGHHWQLGLTPIIRQKNHQLDPPDDVDLPGDLLLNAKFGSIGPRKWPIRLALQIDARVPMAAHHNIPLQPYSANAFGYGATGFLSFAGPSQPQSGFALDFNVGWFNHNDGDLHTTSENDTLNIPGTTELVFGSSARLMGSRFGLFAEIHGRQFLQPPPEFAYTRENSMYVTPGFIFQFNPYIRLMASADVMLQGWNDETSYDNENGVLVEKPWNTVPNLPNWRFNFGLSFRLREGKAMLAQAGAAETATGKAAESVIEEQRDEKDKELDVDELEQRLRNKENTPVVESEEERQSRMEAERRRMMEILQRLRKALEEDEIEKEPEE